MTLEKHTHILGTYSTGKKGPLLFVTAAVHGNEPSGVRALERVFKLLKSSQPEINGTIVGVLGNKKAYKEESRFIDEDLNRTWTKKTIESRIIDSIEKKEMFSIIDSLERYPPSQFTNRFFLDCHTTSSDSEPYISVQVINDNDRWAHRFPTHIIRGFSDIVSGTIDHFLSRRGLTGFVLEAGQHNSKDAIDFHEGTIWLALKEACDLNFDDLNSTPSAIHKTLKKSNNRKTFEIIYRHGLENSDNFKMKPGFKNFQPIKKGALLAHHNGKEIISRWDAYIFMPLYQNQGNDGFFIVEKVS